MRVLESIMLPVSVLPSQHRSVFTAKDHTSDDPATESQDINFLDPAMLLDKYSIQEDVR